MKILFSLVACVTLAFLVEDVFAKDCYKHGEVEGNFKLDKEANKSLLAKCVAQENSACIIVNATKEVTDSDGNKKTVAVTVRECETSKDVNCAKHKSAYEGKADYKFIKCFKCNPDKCNIDFSGGNTGTRVVVSSLLLAIPFALIGTTSVIY